MQQVILPSIGTSGSFIFLEPFNKEEYNNLQLTVESVRSLVELSRSGIDPFTTIYEPYLLSETDFQDALDNNIPILVLRTLDNNLLYVPADRVSKLPDTTGVRYQETDHFRCALYRQPVFGIHCRGFFCGAYGLYDSRVWTGCLPASYGKWNSAWDNIKILYFFTKNGEIPKNLPFLFA